MATDVDLYAQTAHLKRGKGSSAPDLVEVDLAAALLMSIHELLQQIAHFTAAAAPPKSGKAKVKKLPRPVTAEQIYARQKARREFHEIEQALNFVDLETFERRIAAAQGG